jgi:monofunctional biosynthetic peptidoglycan transglycosylase
MGTGVPRFDGGPPSHPPPERAVEEPQQAFASEAEISRAEASGPQSLGANVLCLDSSSFPSADAALAPPRSDVRGPVIGEARDEAFQVPAGTPDRRPACPDMAVNLPFEPREQDDSVGGFALGRNEEAGAVRLTHAVSPEAEGEPMGRRPSTDYGGEAPPEILAVAVPRGSELRLDVLRSRAGGVNEGPFTLTPAVEGRMRDASRLLATAARYAVYGAGGYLALVLFLILAYRVVDPPGSALMLFRWLSGTAIESTWVPLERMSPHLLRAVVVAEDGRFCEHWGIDLEAMEDAIEQAGDGIPRGASTISMQVIKNLFLWPSKSYVRKVIELPLTIVMEIVWPKSRILEIYLNVAEWGPGVFGAEAAARHHFAKSASRLAEHEAALLAASLPNPIRRDAGDPGPRTARKARVILARMHAAGPVASCVRAGK